MADDPYDLQRFLDAQENGETYARALAELRAGRKRTHWMWFVFPQIEGLGSSPMARHFAIGSLAEARAYLAHPVLGPRLHESGEALLSADPAASAERVLGGIDALKLRSSATLFLRADPADPLFAALLDRFYGGEPDPGTDARL